MELAGELQLATELADLADAITLPPFAAREVTYDWKANQTEVTALDRGAEAAIAARLAAARPHHGLLGEEHGRWATRTPRGSGSSIPSTARRVRARDPGVGDARRPGRRRRRGRGGRVRPGDGPPLVGGPWRRCVRRRSQLPGLGGRSHLRCPDQHHPQRRGGGPRADVGRRHPRPANTPGAGFGDFWQHCLVAEGALDVAIDAVGVAPYDLAAVKLIVEEAGGTFTDRHGAVTDGATAISSNGRLHDAVMARLGA